jgi:hypothetical protein
MSRATRRASRTASAAVIATPAARTATTNKTTRRRSLLRRLPVPTESKYSSVGTARCASAREDAQPHADHKHNGCNDQIQVRVRTCPLQGVSARESDPAYLDGRRQVATRIAPCEGNAGRQENCSRNNGCGCEEPTETPNLQRNLPLEPQNTDDTLDGFHNATNRSAMWAAAERCNRF